MGCLLLRSKAGLCGSSDIAIVGDQGARNGGCWEAHAAQLPIVLAEVQELQHAIRYRSYSREVH